ncbi:hypothetical protein EI94DRAFT_1061760 [Lactarius quietus]|nr:hypothetical protein EI94DRAFT_1061760 [Lactarius quietus]
MARLGPGGGITRLHPSLTPGCSPCRHNLRLRLWDEDFEELRAVEFRLCFVLFLVSNPFRLALGVLPYYIITSESLASFGLGVNVKMGGQLQLPNLKHQRIIDLRKPRISILFTEPSICLCSSSPPFTEVVGAWANMPVGVRWSIKIWSPSNAHNHYWYSG